MKVRELINILNELPQELEVCTWDADEDDYVPITDAIWEDGHSTVDLMTNTEFSTQTVSEDFFEEDF